MLTVVVWIHLWFVSMLVGAMTFVFFILRPALSRQAEEPPMKTLSSFIRARFRWIAVLLAAVIIASGIVNIIIAPPRRWYIALLIVKVLLAIAVVFFYFRNAFAKAPPASAGGASEPSQAEAVEVRRPEKAGEWKTAWLLSPTASQVKMELILIIGALLVILLGVILAQSPAA